MLTVNSFSSLSFQLSRDQLDLDSIIDVARRHRNLNEDTTVSRWLTPNDFTPPRIASLTRLSARDVIGCGVIVTSCRFNQSSCWLLMRPVHIALLIVLAVPRHLQSSYDNIRLKTIANQTTKLEIFYYWRTEY